MPINLHLTPTVPCKHPSIAGAFLILALVSAHSRLSPTLVLQLLHRHRKAEIHVLADAEKGTVIHY